MVSDGIAVALLALLAVGWAWLLRDHAPGSWPRSLAILLPVATLVAVGVVRTGAATFLWRGLGAAEWWLPAALGAVATVVLLLARRAGATWVGASWLAGAVFLVGLTTLPSGGDGPALAADPVSRLRSCVTAEHRLSVLGVTLGAATPAGVAPAGARPEGARPEGARPVMAIAAPPRTSVTSHGLAGVTSARVPTSMPALDGRKLATDQLPNVALFVPLGIGVAAITRRRTRWWIALAVVTSVGIESYQAVFTSRTCSTVDVATNALGVLAGWAAHAVATRRLSGR